MRRRVLGIGGVAVLGLGIAVWLGLGRSTGAGELTQEPRTPRVSGKRWEGALREPTPPPGGTLRIQGVVRDEQGPAAGVRVSATRPMPGETLSELECPGSPESGFKPEPKATRLPDCMRDAQSLVLDLVGARYGEAPLYAEATTGADGSFSLEGLPEGKFMLWALGERGAKRQPDVAAGTQGVELVLEEGITLEGIVTDQTGLPMPEVRLTFLHDEHTRFFDTRSGADGHYRVGPLPLDGYALVAEKEGWLPTFLADGMRDLMKGEVVLFRPSHLRGRVLSNGAPVPGAEVRLANRERPDFEEQVAVADAEGRFGFKGLGPGDYQLHAESQGSHAVKETELGVRPPEEVVLKLGEARYVEGTVQDASRRPLEGVHVSLRPEEEYSRSWKAVTDEQGRYRVGPVALGPYAVDVSAPRYVDLDSSPLFLEEATGPVDFTLQAAALVEGVVVDEEGRPVPTIRMDLMHPTEVPGEFSVPPDWTWSDADGRFSMDAPAAGEWVLSISEETFLSQSTRIQAPAQGLRVVLRAGGTVAGTLTDGQGTPVERAWVILWDPKEGRSKRAEPTDEQGRFALRGLEPGRYVVEATQDHQGVDRTASKTVEVRGSEQLEVPLSFEEGWTLTGTVVDGEGQPLEGAAVRAELPWEERPNWRRNARTCGNRETNDAITGPDGRFTVKHLVGERFGVNTWKEGYAPNFARAVGAEVGRGGSLWAREGAQVRLVLEREGRVLGRVVGPDGAPLRRFSLSGRPVSDAAGAFEIPFGGTGEVRFELSAPGLAPVLRTVEVREGIDLDLGEVRLGAGRRVEGRVVDAETGAPVAEARVKIRDGASSNTEFLYSAGMMRLTREDGTFELTEVDEQPMVLVVEHTDYLEASLPLGAGAETVKVTLDPGARVEATLRDARGQPLQGNVTLQQQDGSGWKTILVKGGTGSRRGIAPGLYLARARQEDTDKAEGRYEDFLAQRVRIPPSGVVALNFTQLEGSARLKLRVASAEKLFEVLVVPSALSTPVTEKSLSYWRQAALNAEPTDEGSERTFRQVPPGKVMLLVVNGLSRSQFHLEDLELSQGDEVERVIHPSWKPLPAE